jgi:hypothetical protein
MEFDIEDQRLLRIRKGEFRNAPEDSEHAACPFELIDLGDEREHFGGDRMSAVSNTEPRPPYIHPETPINPFKMLGGKVFNAVGWARSSLARSGNSSMGGKTAKDRYRASFQR